ncbi:MAG TPA: HAD family hydrolase [Rubrobacteraceae bacterium]
MRYDAVFLDVDKTLLWVDVDVEGYVEDLKPYSTNGTLTVEEACEPLLESLHTHISQNINYPTKEELAEFRRENARKTAEALGLDAPTDVLKEVLERRLIFRPYPESEEVMEELLAIGLPLFVVSNWDVALEGVLENLGWVRYFDGIVASAKVGSEKPERAIFEEALRLAGLAERRDRVVHVGNDPVSDVEGAISAGIDAVLIDREGDLQGPEAIVTLADLRGLPAFLRS